MNVTSGGGHDEDEQVPTDGELEAAQAGFDGQGMSPLDPRQLSVLRIRAAIAFAMVLAAAAAIDIGFSEQLAIPRFYIVGAIALIALAGVLALPNRRFRAWAWREDEDELHIRSGMLFQQLTVVPFGRVQHIDIAQGPIERSHGLATLILHTAGTRGASVPLPGLARDLAEQLRDRIRAKIRQDLV